MSAVGARVTVTTAATGLGQAAIARSYSLLVTNRGAVAVDLGGPTVTAGAGYQLDPGASVTISAEKFPSSVYAIAASGSVVCHVLQVEV